MPVAWLSVKGASVVSLLGLSLPVQAEMARRITDLQKSVKEMHAEMSVIVLISKEVSSEADRDNSRALLMSSNDTVHLLQQGQRSYYAVEGMYVLTCVLLTVRLRPRHCFFVTPNASLSSVSLLFLRLAVSSWWPVCWRLHSWIV